MANSIDLIVNTNGVEVLNKTTDAAENAAKAFGATKRELNELQKQLEDMAAAGQQNTEEFRKAAERAGELKSSLQGLTAEINANAGSAFEGISNNVFLFGERLTNLDLKGAGQALTGMGNAVSRINIKSLKDEVGGLVQGLGNLAGAIISNPLLALGGAVALLVLNFDKINAALNGTAQKVEKLGQANEALERQNLILQGRLSIEKTLNENSFYAIKLQKQIAENNVKAAENELEIKQRLGDINGIREAENKLIEARNFLTSITAQQEKDRQGAIDYARSILYKGYKEQLENAKQQQLIETQRVATAELIKQKQAEIGGLRIQESLQIEQANKEEEKKFKNFVQVNNEEKKNYVERAAESDAVKAKQAELNKLIQEEADLKKVSAMLWNGELLKVEEVTKAVGEVIKVQEEAVAEIDNSAAEEFRAAYDAISQVAAEQAKQNELRLLSEKDRELQINKEKYDALIAEADLRGVDTTVFLEAQLSAEAEIKKKYADKELEDAKKLAEDKLAAEQALVDAKFSLASASVNLLGTLFAKNKKAADIAFALDKALAIAGVVVNTQREISSYNSNPLWSAAPDGGASIKIPAILAAKIRAAASIATIAGTTIGKFMNGGNATVGGSAGGTSGGGTTAPSPANFSFVQNQPNQQPPLQAYVVSTQVSSNLEAQQLINNQARLGG